MIRWWTIGGMVHQKSHAREVTHPNNIPTLGGLTSEFTSDLSHPCENNLKMTPKKKYNFLTYSHTPLTCSNFEPTGI
jgi:hypothetical protein